MVGRGRARHRQPQLVVHQQVAVRYGHRERGARPDHLGQVAPPHRPAGGPHLGHHDVGRQREVEQVRERVGPPARHELAWRQHRGQPGRVEHHRDVDVGDGSVDGADPLRRVEVGRVHPAGDHGVGQRRVRGRDQGGAGVASGVGEPRQQVARVVGVGDGEVGAHARGGEERVVDRGGVDRGGSIGAGS